MKTFQAIGLSVSYLNRQRCDLEDLVAHCRAKVEAMASGCYWRDWRKAPQQILREKLYAAEANRLAVLQGDLQAVDCAIDKLNTVGSKLAEMSAQERRDLLAGGPSSSELP